MSEHQAEPTASLSLSTFDKYQKIEAASKYHLPEVPWVLQHKLDGSQAGIQLDHEGQRLLIHSRNTLLATVNLDPTGEDGEDGKLSDPAFALFVRQVRQNAHALYQGMCANLITHIYGEWLRPLKVKYPEAMLYKFYVYDLVEDGVFRSPSDWGNALRGFGFEVMDSQPLPLQLTHVQLREHTLALQELCGYPIEGAVVKSYVADANSQTDHFGKRLIYKDVLPAYHEAKGQPAPDLPTEQAIVATFPTRTLEKRYLDTVAANGGQFEGKLIPQIIGRVWNDFITEHLDDALRTYKYPVVNTRELKCLMDQRAREYALGYVA